MIEREEVVTTAVRAVLLHLRAGKESFTPTWLRAYGSTAVSAYAGSNIRFETAKAMVIGPWAGDGEYNVLMRIMDGGTAVEAYCVVSVQDDQIILISQDIYIDSVKLGKRDVSVTADRMHLEGSPPGFDYGPIADAIVMPDIQFP